MIPLYTQEQYDNAKGVDLLPCKCKQCEITFYKKKSYLQSVLCSSSTSTGDFCSQKCLALSMNKKIKYNCHHCGVECEKKPSQMKLADKHFCSHYCSSFYHSQNRTTGNNRSKLEMWIESQLTLLYPNLEVHYNRKEAIKAELDVYIPSLQLAFELNGIFHYEPIFGADKLTRTQTNDNRKYQACVEANIDLCIINTTPQKYFKESNSIQYLDVITNIINKRILS